jgi:hypothetical protein
MKTDYKKDYGRHYIKIIVPFRDTHLVSKILVLIYTIIGKQGTYKKLKAHKTAKQMTGWNNITNTIKKKAKLIN